MYICLLIVLVSVQLFQVRAQGWKKDLPGLYPSLPIAAPLSDNEACRNDSRLLMQGLNNFTLWAVQMLDASSREASGILFGSLYQMGNYDECLEVTKPVHAQYCLVKLSVKVSRNASSNFDPYVLMYDPHLSVWDRIKSEENPARVPRNSVYQALCVPASCSPQDIETAVSQYLRKHKNPAGVEYTAKVAPNLCSSNKEEPYTLEDHVFMNVIGFIVSLTVIGTFVDYAYGGKQSGVLLLDLFLCFSLKQNLMSLYPSREPTKLDVLNSIKLICMCSIILSHRGAYFGASPLWNVEYLEREFRSTRLAFIHRADLIVDNFFVISGLLMAYLLLKELPKRRIKAIYLILLRILRLIPALSVMVFFYATVFYKLGSGPRWDVVVGPEREYCRKNWWTNLLFINNYIDEQHMCLLQSYFLACDMHFFIIAIPLVTLLWRRPTLGAVTLVVLTVFSIIMPFLVTYLNRKAALVTFYVDVLITPRANDVFNSVYVKSHARASPYLIGLATGYLLHKLENSKFKLGLSQSTVLCWSITSMLSAIAMCGALFYDSSRQYSAMEAGLFAGLHRFFWALGISGFILVTTFGTVPVLSAFLSNKVLISLGNLVYGLVLVHPVFQYWGLGSLRRPEYLQYSSVILTGSGDIFLSLIAALGLYLTVEEPFRQITKLILSKRPVAKVNGKSE